MRLKAFLKVVSGCWKRLCEWHDKLESAFRHEHNPHCSKCGHLGDVIRDSIPLSGNAVITVRQCPTHGEYNHVTYVTPVATS